MKPFFFLVLVVALAGAVLAALVWIVRLRKALRQKQEENQRLKRVLLLGSHSAQEDLSALRKLRHDLRHYLLMTDTATLPEDLGKTLEQPLSAEGGQSWALTSLERYYREQGEALGFETDIRLNLELPQEEYTELLAKLAARSAKTGREEILLNSRDRAAVGAAVVARANQLLAKEAAPALPEELKESRAGRIIDKVVTGASAILQGTAMLTLAGETRDITGGLILRDGKVEINCAFETQLRLLRDEMSAQVAAALLG